MKVYKLMKYEIKPNVMYDQDGKRLIVVAIDNKAYKELVKMKKKELLKKGKAKKKIPKKAVKKKTQITEKYEKCKKKDHSECYCQTCGYDKCNPDELPCMNCEKNTIHSNTCYYKVKF